MLFCYEIYKLLIRLHSNLKKIFLIISEKRLLSLTLQHSPQAIFFHFFDFCASINNWISFFVTFLILTAAGQSHNIWISVECFCLEIRFIYTSLQVQSYQPYLKKICKLLPLFYATCETTKGSQNVCLSTDKKPLFIGLSLV